MRKIFVLLLFVVSSFIISPEAFSAAFFEDDFNVSSDRTLDNHTPTVTGDGWTLVRGYSAQSTRDDVNTDYMKVLDATDTVYRDGAHNSAGCIYTADVSYPGADYSVQCVGTDIDASDDYTHLVVRVQDGDNMYGCRFLTTNSQLWKIVSDSITLIGSAQSGVADGSVIKLSIIGTTLESFDDGSSLQSTTVSDHAAAGKGGMGLGNIGGYSWDVSDQQEDDFEINQEAGAPSGPAFRVLLISKLLDFFTSSSLIGILTRSINI